MHQVAVRRFIPRPSVLRPALTRDAHALLQYLAREGVVDVPVEPLPDPLCAPTPLEGVEPLHAPHAGVLVFLKISDLSLEQPVYFPGNTQHGIWACPRLVTVYESKPSPDERQGWFGR